LNEALASGLAAWKSETVSNKPSHFMAALIPRLEPCRITREKSAPD
jgi:hypothetical protein